MGNNDNKDYVQKVAIYCRLSKEDVEKISKDNDSESIQNQKLLLMEYAINKGWQIYKVYADDDFSGLDSDRPEFNTMIKDGKDGMFDIILCKNQSRFSRDMAVVENYLHNKFILWGIRFIGVVDGVDTDVKSNKKSRQINSLINEWYCEDLSENVKAALVAKKKTGQYLGYWCTFGYQLAPNDKHKLIVDTYAAEIVGEIYRLYLNGKGITHIARLLTEKGYMTPTEYKNFKGKAYYNPSAKNKGIWSPNTIRKILKDKTYLGHLIQGRQQKISYKFKKMAEVPEENWIVVENNHTPIIDKNTFDRVQEIFKSKSRKQKK